MRVKNPVFTLSALCLLFILVQIPSGQAGKWKMVDRAETVLEFRNWPSTENCQIGKRMADDYSMEVTIARCPRYPARGAASTYIRVSDLSPGFHWSGSKGADIRESPVFQKSSGWFYNFYGARFDPDQQFTCYRDSACAWRRITFNVDETPCQFVQIIPGVGGTNDFYGQRDSPLALTLVHCGTGNPIGRKNIVYENDKVVLIYPGGGDSTAKQQTSISDLTDPAEIRKSISTLESERTRSEQRCVHGERTHCTLADEKRSRIAALREKLKDIQTGAMATQNSESASVSGRDICNRALNYYFPNRWSKAIGDRRFVNLARGRGYSTDDCNRILDRPINR